MPRNTANTKLTYQLYVENNLSDIVLMFSWFALSKEIYCNMKCRRAMCIGSVLLDLLTKRSQFQQYRLETVKISFTFTCYVLIF